MYIKRFFQKLFCRCTSCKVHPFVATDIPEEDLISKAEIKKFKRVPNDQFTCNKCGIVPEILEMHSDTGNLTLNCNKHGIKPISSTKYLNSLRKSNFTYLKLKCAECHSKPSGRETQMQFCVLCRIPLCKKCCDTTHEEHRNYLISIGEINNICRIHKNEKAELYCLDCEEIICKMNKSHENHATFNTSKILNDVKRSRKIIVNKTNKLFSMIRLLRLINSKGNDDSKVLLEKAILKEEKRNENDVDLAIYYLKHKELEEKLSKENKGGEVLIKN